MGSISTIVNVQITRQTRVPTRAGFGFANFVSNQAVFQERIKAYGSIQEVEQDDLAGADTLSFAQKYFGQDLRPTRLYVTKKARDLGAVIVLTYDAEFVTGNTVNTTVNGGTPIATPFNTDSDTTLGDHATAIAGEANVASAVADTATNTITVTMNDGFALALTATSVTGGASQAGVTQERLQYEDTLDTIVNSLIDAQATNDDWYALAMYSKEDADILAVAAWVESKVKIFGAASDDTAILGSGSSDIASQLQALDYDRTSVIYNEGDEDHPWAAWFGGQLPKDPGSVNWANKSLSGITPDNILDGAKANAHSKNANTYTTIGGLNITESGQVASGEYIDTIRGTDWIQVRMQEKIFGTIANEDKIPYTQQGIGVIENDVRAILRQAVNMGILAADPEFTVTPPIRSEVPSADVANRVLNGMTFDATYAGAINKVNIQGTISL